jgi:polysaccharide chain length determinant protein (PEP-CTERM system associated)
MQDLLHVIRTELRGSWRYRWPAMIIAWVVCLLGWVGVFTMPDIYEARAQVYVDADSRLADVMGQVGVAPSVGARVFVVRQAMLGRPQLERVARETDLDLRARDREEKEKLILSLREKIKVNSGRSREAQNLYTITFNDRDRKMAVAVVQTLLDTFVEDVLELKAQGTEDVTTYLEDQLQHYSKLLADADLALADFRKQYVGLLPGDSGGVFDRLQAEMEKLAELRSELRIQQGRRDELRRQLQSETPYLPEGAEGAAGASLPGGTAQAQIKELETRRAALLLMYTDRHPDVIAIDEQLQQLYSKRDEERAALAGNSGIEGAANSTNPVYQSVQIALNETGVRIAGLRSQISQSEAVVRQLNSQVDTIPEVEAKYADLSRNYAQYKSLYDEVLMRKERERMGSAGEERDVVSFNVIDPPAASLEPVAPKRGLLLVGVLILGLGAGGAVAFLLHQLNPVFHDPRTLRTVTGRPVLGVVSMTWLERHKGRRQVDLSSFALASASLIVVFVGAMLLQEQLVGVMHTLMWQATG